MSAMGRALAPQPQRAAVTRASVQRNVRCSANRSAPPPRTRRAPRATLALRAAAASDAAAAAAAATETATAEAQTSEAAGYKKRAEESAAAGIAPAQRPPAGGDAPPPGSWSWTLNWDPVLLTAAGDAEVIVGSCPKCAADVHRIADESPATAILCLQSDDCLTALGVDLPAVRAAAASRGLLWTRVVVRDFDRLDQATALPNMARALAALLALGRVPYVHCTAGINRAPLCVVGMLTFCRGWELDDAVAQLKAQRGQANPYCEPWKAARARLLAGREEEIYARVVALGGDSKEGGGDWIARDWSAAQREVIMESFKRATEADMELLRGAAALGGVAPPSPTAAAAAQQVEAAASA